MDFGDDSEPGVDEEARAAGKAALSICESLALSLIKQEVLSREAVGQAIESAAEAHRDSARSSSDAKVHRRAAALADQVRGSVEASAKRPHSPYPDSSARPFPRRRWE